MRLPETTFNGVAALGRAIPSDREGRPFFTFQSSERLGPHSHGVAGSSIGGIKLKTSFSGHSKASALIACLRYRFLSITCPTSSDLAGRQVGRIGEQTA